MNDAELKIVVEAVRHLMQENIDMRAEIAALQGTICKLLPPDDWRQSLAMLHEIAESAREKRLLQLGDSQPLLADLLGASRPMLHTLDIPPTA